MRWRPLWTVAAVTIVAAVLRVWGIQFGLPHTFTRPDEETVAGIAARMLAEGPNPRFFNYPTLYIYLVAFLDWACFRGAGPSDAARFLLDRVTVAVLGTATVPVLFVAARRLFTTSVATIAAALLAVAFLHVRDSHFGVTDVPATFMVVLAFAVAATRSMDRAHRWNIVMGALVCGLAASTKYNAVCVVAPLIVAALQQNVAAERPAWRAAAAGIGLIVVIACGVAIGFVLGTPYAILDREKFMADRGAERLHFAAGHLIQVGVGWMHHLSFSLLHGLGPAFLLAAGVGSAWLLATDRRRAALVLSFPVAYYLAMGPARTVFVRYVVPLVPFAALLAAVAVDGLARRAGRLVGGGHTARGVIAATLTMVVAASSLSRSIAFDRLLDRTDNRVRAGMWVQAAFPDGATIHQTGSPYGRLQLVPGWRFPQWAFDAGTGTFRDGGRPLAAWPRLVIVQTSPLTVYSEVPPALSRVLRDRYRSLQKFEVEDTHSSASPVFDQQDAFYVPLSGLERYRRPGPMIEVFELIAARP
jgi:4-amino-4-deoxy-L-arabinose transferase-like glycosyltransferase